MATEAAPEGVQDGAEPLVGQTLAGRWQVVRLLGRGGMSTVYEALQDGDARVALKLLSPELARNPRARARFLREGRVANTVGHPNAVHVFDGHLAEGGHLFLVMELLQGQTLRQRRLAAGGRLSQSEVLHAAQRVLEVLSAAHDKAIFHRDVKPENIFLTSDGQVKVLDFGIAAVRDEAAEDAQITRSGVSLGTPAFMAPEQARGRHSHIDARTDVWAVGATMFLCLSGRHVHEDASTANEALIFSATQRAPPLGRFCPDVRAEVARVVDRALALEPADRWESAEAMRDALMQAVQGSAGEGRAAGALDAAGTITQDEMPPPSTPLAPSTAGTARARASRWPALALILAVVAAAGFAIRPRASPGVSSTPSPLVSLGVPFAEAALRADQGTPIPAAAPENSAPAEVQTRPSPPSGHAPPRTGSAAVSVAAEPRVPPERVSEDLLDRRK